MREGETGRQGEAGKGRASGCVEYRSQGGAGLGLFRLGWVR